ncbi:four helix bundle protein [Planctellipticum variicoloris]|uniref:four helix bundle protein n=1 Tax=Planctellipticum variicoloris TaxID=3064265 RepID=UPI003AF9C6A1
MGTSRHDNEALEERLLEFAARCGRVVESLPDTRMGRHVAGQFVRCGTAAAPNYAEACAAESRNDFVHKLGIALKELRESRIWLKLAIKCELLPSARLLPLVAECNELMGIIGQSIITAKSNRGGASTRETRSE